jgi:hypothetical protein
MDPIEKKKQQMEAKRRVFEEDDEDDEDDDDYEPSSLGIYSGTKMPPLRKLVPFTPRVAPGADSGLAAKTIASQLNNVIKLWREKGWQYLHLETITFEVPPGCLAGILGAKQEQFYSYHAVFEKVGEGA